MVSNQESAGRTWLTAQPALNTPSLSANALTYVNGIEKSRNVSAADVDTVCIWRWSCRELGQRFDARSGTGLYNQRSEAVERLKVLGW